MTQQRYTFSTYVSSTRGYDEDPTNYASLYLGDLREDAEGDLVDIELCSGSDYSGSSVTVANYSSILKEFSEALERAVWPYYGGHGTYGIVVKDSALTEHEWLRLVSIIIQLQDYPLIDEDEWSKVESEAEDEAWDSWLGWDVARRIEDLFEGEGHDVEVMQGTVDEKDKLRVFFEMLMESKNEYYVHETGNQASVDVDGILPDLMTILVRPEFVKVDKEFN
jgi:hypothetical protein